MMWFRFILLMLLITSLGAITACNDNANKPEELIDENVYVNLLVELQLARTYAESAELDSMAIDSLAREIYTKYGTSDDQFRESHEYYQQFPKEQKERIDQAIELLRGDQVEDNTQTKENEDTVSKDSVSEDTVSTDTLKINEPD